MRRRAVTALALLSLGLVGVAGCGGDSASETTTTSLAPATAPATPPPPTASLPDTAPGAPLGDESLPSPTAVPGVERGDVQTLRTAGELVDLLYQSGDPTKPGALARLEDAGFAGAVLRDQPGTDPSVGIALLRSYAIRLRDEAAARDEVTAAVDEVRRSAGGASSDIDVSEIPGAQALRVQVDQGGQSGTVVFVTFPAGPVVYGIQGVSASGLDTSEEEIIGAARALAKRAGATP